MNDQIENPRCMVVLNHGGRYTRTVVSKALRSIGATYNYATAYREAGHTYPARWYVIFGDAAAEAKIDRALRIACDQGANIECYAN